MRGVVLDQFGTESGPGLGRVWAEAGPELGPNWAQRGGRLVGGVPEAWPALGQASA